MKRSAVSFDSIPAAATSVTNLNICLKCAFDFFTKQLKLTPRTAYSELKKHVPEEQDFTGSATSRPHFFAEAGSDRCPYCQGTKRWFAQFRAIRIDAHPSIEKERKRLWTALKKEPDHFTIWSPERTQMQIFSEWLERVKKPLDLDGDDWLLAVAVEQMKRSHPNVNWAETLAAGLKRVQLSRQFDKDFTYENGWLYVAPPVYGDILLVQHLVSRSHLHGGRTFEGRLTLQELMGRLRRISYLETRGIEASEMYEAFEQAVSALVASGPTAVYYAVDRRDYLKQLKSIYEKKRDK